MFTTHALTVTLRESHETYTVAIFFYVEIKAFIFIDMKFMKVINIILCLQSRMTVSQST